MFWIVIDDYFLIATSVRPDLATSKSTNRFHHPQMIQPRHPPLRHIVVYCALVLLAIVSLGRNTDWQRHCFSFSGPPLPPSPTSSPLRQTSGGVDAVVDFQESGRVGLAPPSASEDNDVSPNCDVRLDALERMWDDRRSVRLQLLQDAKNAGKNIYDYLWKKKLSNKEEAERSKKFRFDLWEPEAVCLTEERFGGQSDTRYDAFGDGPKFVCGVDYIRELYNSSKKRDARSLSSSSAQEPPKPCLVYSVGSNNNIKFEQAVKKHIGCEIHTFDPTLKSRFVGSRYATFHPWGLGADGETVHFEQGDNINATFATFSMDHIIKKLGHTRRKIDILKIDCERCEYTAMPPVFDAVADGRLEIDQILIELHREPYETLTEFFASADGAGYRITHKERNGWGCQGNACVEYVFVRESFLRRATAAAIC